MTFDAVALKKNEKKSRLLQRFYYFCIIIVWSRFWVFWKNRLRV